MHSILEGIHSVLPSSQPALPHPTRDTRRRTVITKPWDHFRYSRLKTPHPQAIIHPASHHPTAPCDGRGLVRP